MTSLPASLTSLSLSLSHLSTSLSHLDSCTSDLPRLRHVLSLHPHFALLPSSRLAAAEERIAADIAPEIESLLRVVEDIVRRREGRAEWCRRRGELYAGRLGDADMMEEGGKEGGDKEREIRQRAERTRQKKERLSYAVERLTLQAGQRERQLRMSVAAQGVEVEVEEEEGDSGF